MRSLVVGLLRVARGVGILVDVGELSLVHLRVLVGLSVEPDPEGHPDIAQRTDDDERHLPAKELGQHRNGEGSNQGTHGSTAVEDGGGIGAVFLREVLGRHLNGCGEVAGLTQSEDAACTEEQPHGNGRNGQGRIGYTTGLEGAQRLLGSLEAHEPVAGDDAARGNAAEGMQHSTCRPDKDGPEIATAGAHPVDNLTGEQHAQGVDDGEIGGDGTVVIVAPAKFLLDTILTGIGQREHLTVHVVDCCCKEQHCTDYPTIVGHLGSFDRTH